MTIFEGTRLLNTDIPMCTCGRRSDKMHCPLCGSFNIYGTRRTTKHVNPVSGEAEDYLIFRCRKCSMYFDVYMVKFEDCKAPEVEIRGRKTSKQVNKILHRQAEEKGIDPRIEAMLQSAIDLRVKLGKPPMTQEERDKFITDAQNVIS